MILMWFGVILFGILVLVDNARAKKWLNAENWFKAFVDPKTIRGHKRMLQMCDRYAALWELNQQYHFHALEPDYTYEALLSSLTSFRNFNSMDWLSEQMRQEYDAFCSKIEQAIENQKMLQDYDRGLMQLPARTTKRFWRKREKHGMAKAILRPVTEFTVTVCYSYTSPAGRNHYEDTYVFYMEEISKYCNSWRNRALVMIPQQRQSRSRMISSGVSEVFVQQQRTIAKSIRYDILERDGFACQICGRTAADGVKLEVDHIVPVSKGGRSVPENLRTLCYDCNRGKGAKLPKAETSSEAEA